MFYILFCLIQTENILEIFNEKYLSICSYLQFFYAFEWYRTFNNLEKNK